MRSTRSTTSDFNLSLKPLELVAFSLLILLSRPQMVLAESEVAKKTPAVKKTAAALKNSVSVPKGQPKKTGLPKECAGLTKAATSLKFNEISFVDSQTATGLDKQGQNPKTIILVNAEPDGLIHYSKIIPTLAQNFRVVSYDLRGIGLTPAKGDNLTLNVHVEDLKKMMKELKIETASFIADPIGAKVILKLSESSSDKIEELIVLKSDKTEITYGAVNAAGPKENPLGPKNCKSTLNQLKQIKLAQKQANDKADLQAIERALQDLSVNGSPVIDSSYQTHLLKNIVGKPGFLQSRSQIAGSILLKMVLQQTDVKSAAGKLVVKKKLRVVDASRVEDSELLQRLFPSESFDHRIKERLLLSKQSAKSDSTPTFKQVLGEGLLPRGSALMTTSGKLADKGILAIVHPATGAMTKSGGSYEPTLDSIEESIDLSIQLAVANHFENISVPFLGGGIFASRMNVTTEKLAESIIRATQGSVVKLAESSPSSPSSKIAAQIVLWSKDAEGWELFNRVCSQIKERNPSQDLISCDKLLVKGNIVENHDDRPRAIINAANMEIQFGGGLSGVIGKASGNSNGIDNEAALVIQLAQKEAYLVKPQQ